MRSMTGEMAASAGVNRLVVVSNRLPVVVKKDDAGAYTLTSGSGGLITALAPVLRHRGGLWIGWPGCGAAADVAPLLAGATRDTGYTLVPVYLEPIDVEEYYDGFSNQVLWPVCHDLSSKIAFLPRYWQGYRRVNRRFAEVVAARTGAKDFVWVHDYHLLLLASCLRELEVGRRTGFFLHVPFPPLDLFLKLPWRSDLLRGLLEYDLIGVQTVRDRRNLVSCVRALVRDSTVSYERGMSRVTLPGGREVRIGSFPISIDFAEFAHAAASPEVSKGAWLLHEKFPGQELILGLDRLDYSKGILQRLDAFELALERHDELHGRVTLIAVVVPSRSNLPEYDLLKREIERRVGEVNGRFGQPGWVPIQYAFRSLTRGELLAYYRTCEIALLTPLKDGMNLVAKEFCAASLEENAVVILSEFAGAASQMQRGALLVNPFDVEQVADAIHTAAFMPATERRRRMRLLRRELARQDIYWWVDAFLGAAIGGRLASFPQVEEYLERIEVS